MKLDGIVYDSPVAFSLSQRTALATVPFAAAWSLRAMMAACRWETRPADARETRFEAGRPVLAGFWHENMALAGYFFRNSGAHTLTSYSFDGELAARTVRHFGLLACRGSSSRGGTKALEQLERVLDAGGWVGFTLDGPRKPRRRAKLGSAILAARTQLPIVPVAFAISGCWRLKSWDRMCIPKPGQRVVAAFADPVPPPAEETRAAFEATARQTEAALNALQEALEAELGVDIG